MAAAQTTFTYVIVFLLLNLCGVPRASPIIPLRVRIYISDSGRASVFPVLKFEFKEHVLNKSKKLNVVLK
jgi:hypothetical protein